MIRRISFRKVLSSFQRIIASRHFLAITAITIGLNSCYNEPQFLGDNLIPNGDKTSVKMDTSFAVSAYTIETDSIPTSFYNLATLGVINSSVFGKTKADFLAQFWIYGKDSIYRMASKLIVPDSTFLTLRLKNVYGTDHQTINVKVYELTQALNIDSAYNGLEKNIAWRHSSVLIGETPYSGDSILKIKLSNVFAQKLLDSDSAQFSADTSFTKYMKGLYVTCDDLVGAEKVMYYFNYNAELDLRYTFMYEGKLHDTIFRYGSSYYGPKFNHYAHDPSVNPSLKINHQCKIGALSTATQDSVFYIQGLGGVRGLIRFDGVPAWAEKMPIAINRAELRFDVQDSPEFPYDSIINPLHYYHYRIYSNSYAIGSNDVLGIFDSQLSGGSEASGYNRAKRYYSIDVTLHLQNLIRGKISKNYIFLEPNNFKVGYKEGLFRSGSNSKPIKLIITYSKL